MASKTTRDAALSRLFGNDSVDTPDDNAEAAADAGEAEGGGGPGSPLASNRAALAGTGNAPRPRDGGGEELATGRSGYLGAGKYAREDQIVERITPYVRPDQAEALRIAVATKRDPRGTDMSQIVQSLLDEAGYRKG